MRALLKMTNDDSDDEEVDDESDEDDADESIGKYNIQNENN
jgi:hypothetical protein